jgi:hypothetical protein
LYNNRVALSRNLEPVPNSLLSSSSSSSTPPLFPASRGKEKIEDEDEHEDEDD